MLQKKAPKKSLRLFVARVHREVPKKAQKNRADCLLPVYTGKCPKQFSGQCTQESNLTQHHGVWKLVTQAINRPSFPTRLARLLPRFARPPRFTRVSTPSLSSSPTCPPMPLRPHHPKFPRDFFSREIFRAKIRARGAISKFAPREFFSRKKGMYPSITSQSPIL